MAVSIANFLPLIMFYSSHSCTLGFLFNQVSKPAGLQKQSATTEELRTSVKNQEPSLVGVVFGWLVCKEKKCDGKHNVSKATIVYISQLTKIMSPS